MTNMIITTIRMVPLHSRAIKMAPHGQLTNSRAGLRKQISLETQPTESPVCKAEGGQFQQPGQLLRSTVTKMGSHPSYIIWCQTM